eukprot:scaffold1664_cov193-Alexandrium_tamarense.AAC.9
MVQSFNERLVLPIIVTRAFDWVYATTSGNEVHRVLGLGRRKDRLSDTGINRATDSRPHVKTTSSSATTQQQRTNIRKGVIVGALMMLCPLRAAFV